ncbi:hypothetical protein L596_026669 [Steinernema carpocapsae]|uniref:Uncharacterized protein n=1 Tax=Steinernema carpocapsae TaxID=34508 RepID=A0A4U5M238_STECR|nr:hypothetical protein L596_026669 [Steinernema carpocapsae]
MDGIRIIGRRSNACLRGVTKVKDITEAAARRKLTLLRGWPTPATTSGPHALKHGFLRQHDPKETRWADEFAKKLGTKNCQKSSVQHCLPRLHIRTTLLAPTRQHENRIVQGKIHV